MSAEQGLTPVDVITRHHRYRGQVPNPGHRIADILADPRTEILEMRDTVASTLGSPAKEMHFKQLFLKKTGILMAILQGEYEAPLNRCNQYVQKDRYGAMVVLPGYILSGIMHLGTHAVPARLLTDSTTLPSFLGMTHVTLHSQIGDRLPSTCKVAIVQRESIEALELTPERLPKR